MNPAAIDDMSWAMAEVYGAVTDQILINLANHFKYVQAKGEITGSFEYQAKMLAQMGQVRQETIFIIQEHLGDADDALAGALQEAILLALKDEEPKLRKAAEKGLLRGGVPELSPNQLQAFRAYYRQSADKLNLVNTVMLESTQAAYAATVSDVVNKVQRTQSILNSATGEVVTGVSSWNQALHGAVQKMVQNGLTGFIDRAGHKWSPEAYVAMDIRTTMFNTSRAAIWERSEQYGNDLYQVSSHQGARPLCYPWQGKVISTTGRTGTTEDLDGNTVVIHSEDEIESFRYGGGLFGVNCGHYPMVFIPGVSTLKGEPQDPEENAKTYAESQQQRALERKLREEKRDLEVMKAQGASPQEIAAQRERVRNASADIDQFCQDTGRTRKRGRESTPVRAEWPDGVGGSVTRYNNGYIGTNETPPPKGQIRAIPEPISVRNELANEITQEKQTIAPFVPAKTKQEAEQFATIFGTNIDYNGLSLENMNKVNEALYELQNDYPWMDKYSSIKQNGRMKSVARANYAELEINGKKISMESSQKLFEMNQKIDSATLRVMKEKWEGRTVPKAIADSMEKLENSLKFKRWSVSEEYGVRGVITHEYGHTVADQVFGQINGSRVPTMVASTSKCNELAQMVKNTMKRAVNEGDIYKLSKYGASNEHEFFAETFCAKQMGEQLPDYITGMLNEVIENGITGSERKKNFNPLDVLGFN